MGDLFPELIEEINYVKSPIDPYKLGAGSEKTVWWKCKFGHEWEAPIRRRTFGGAGCRFCTSQTSSPEIRVFTELKEVFGNVIGREKVEGKEIDIVIPSIKVAVEYDGAYFHKDKSDYDDEKKELIEKAGFKVFRMRETPLKLSDNDVAVKPSHAAPSKDEVNKLIEKIAKFLPSAKKKIQDYLATDQFLADKEYKRILSYLPGPPEEESLKKLHPDLAKQWNSKKNHPLKANMFHPRSGKKVWWRCDFGHEWEATIDKRAGAGRGCPYCTNKKVGYGNSLAAKYPEIAKMWYQPQNGELTPENVTFGSGVRAWWICEKGHFSRSRVADKIIKPKCLYCPGVGRNRKYTPPDFNK
jgi:very-short-patch-repair endonuclease